MGRTARAGVVAIVLLGMANLTAFALRPPTATPVFPPIQSLAVPGWTAGKVAFTLRNSTYDRLVQIYNSRSSNAQAFVESRCEVDPKEFLKWNGGLAYEGAGYERMTSISVTLPQLPRTVVTQRYMRGAQGGIVVVYGYMDHRGTHPETTTLWPNAALDLLTRHPGPYCVLGVAVPIVTNQAQAITDATYLFVDFAPHLQAIVSH